MMEPRFLDTEYGASIAYHQVPASGSHMIGVIFCGGGQFWWFIVIWHQLCVLLQAHAFFPASLLLEGRHVEGAPSRPKASCGPLEH